LNNAEFLEKLASHSPGTVDTSERLGMLGKRAAGMYIAKEANSLTDAVQTAIQDEGLSADQVRRVSETANQATWKELFGNQGNRDVQFDPADSSEVLDRLSTKPEVVQKNPVLDYMEDPPGEAAPDVDMKALFGVKDEPGLPAFDSLRESQVDHEKTAAAADVMRHGLDLLQPELETASARFYSLVKQAHLTEGAGFLQIARAVGMVTEDDFAQRTMEVVGKRLQEEGVEFNHTGELSKLAEAVVVDAEHPVLVAAVHLEKVAEAFSRAAKARRKLDAQEDQAFGVLRDKLRGP